LIPIAYSEGMPEKIPVPDNLYDETGRVKDIDAAQEMAELEQHHRIFDEMRLFRPRKKELAEREARLESIGRKVLAEKQQQHEAIRASESRAQVERAKHEEFIQSNLQQSGLSQEAWLAPPLDEQHRLERTWERAEQQSPEWMIEQELKTLVGHKVVSFEVGDSGEIELRFDDGYVLSFQTQDGDANYIGDVEVRKTGESQLN
jgi:ribosome-binding protein aMBF1 (putative translation factor)